MHLINTTTLTLEYFIGDNVPPYAILSHTWGEEEVTFHDITDTKKILNWKGYAKIRRACDLARRDDWKYIWIDTCCINKESSAELSESINSMFNWYRDAQICYAYLIDVPRHDIDPSSPRSAFYKSRWFKRGWTLQELIAPSELVFYDMEWKEIGTKFWLYETISRITGIPSDTIVGGRFMDLPVAVRMSWAAKRQTTRGEDIAYSLMGLFGVNMPLLYGEGSEKAFIRFQEEIMKTSDDHSIFAWFTDAHPEVMRGMLAHSPADFATSSDITRLERNDVGPQSPSYMTNLGLKIDLALRPLQKGDPFRQHESDSTFYLGPLFVAALHCYRASRHSDTTILAILLVKLFDGTYRRMEVSTVGEVQQDFLRRERTTIYVTQMTLDFTVGSTPGSNQHLPLQGPISIKTDIQVADSGFIRREVYSEGQGFQVGFSGSTFYLSKDDFSVGIMFRNPSTQVEFAVVFGRHYVGKTLFCRIITRSVRGAVQETRNLILDHEWVSCDRASEALNSKYSVSASIRRKGSLERNRHLYHAIIHITRN